MISYVVALARAAGLFLLPYVVTALCVLVLLFILWKGFGCDKSADEPETPADIPVGEVLDDIPGDSDIRGLDNATTRNIRSARRGVAPSEATEEAEAFVAAAQDSSLPVVLPFVRGRYNDERLSLAVGRSDGSVLREDFDGCSEPCDFGSGDSTLFAHEPRAIGRLPDFLKDAATCAAFGAAGYGVAWGVQQFGDEGGTNVDPLLVAGISGGGCVVAKIAF